MNTSKGQGINGSCCVNTMCRFIGEIGIFLSLGNGILICFSYDNIRFYWYTIKSIGNWNWTFNCCCYGFFLIKLGYSKCIMIFYIDIDKMVNYRLGYGNARLNYINTRLGFDKGLLTLILLNFFRFFSIFFIFSGPLWIRLGNIINHQQKMGFFVFYKTILPPTTEVKTVV